MARAPRRRRAAKSASPPNPTSIMAQVDGSGTVNAPNRPSVSPLMPSVKKRVIGSPVGPPLPNIKSQRPPAVLPGPGLTGIVPSNVPVVALKALILAFAEAKIADQQVAAELAETGRRDRHAPRRGKFAGRPVPQVAA